MISDRSGTAGRDAPAAPVARIERDPDYVVSSASTDAASALFGVHDLQPMDAYGKRLYELVSRAFVMHFALCLHQDVVTQRAQVVVDLRYTLWRDPARALPAWPAWRDRTVVDGRDVRYPISGCEVSKINKILFEHCIDQAFHNTGFPLADDGAPREILHPMAVDFAAIQDSLDGMCASVP